jgi:dTDP-4-dehydrorhamnose reductase
MSNWKFVESTGYNTWNEPVRSYTSMTRGEACQLVNVPHPQGYSTFEDIKIGVTGPAGRLARALMRIDRNIVPLFGDITDPEFETLDCDVIINCAAKTNVCEAEGHEQETFKSNVEGPYNLGRLCAKRGIRLVHISTDHIFDGRTSSAPFKEDSEPNPAGVYAITKLLGEQAVTTAMEYTWNDPNPAIYTKLFSKRLLIIRTSFIDFFSGQKAFVDKYFSGDDVNTIAIEILKAAQMDVGGVLHIGTGKKSIYDVARKIAPGVQPQLLRENPINPVGLKYLKDTSLDTTRWEQIKKKAEWV